MEYFVLKGHDTTGPFSEEELRRSFAGQRLSPTDLIRPGDERHWTPLRKLLDHLDGIDTPPSPAPREPSIADVVATMAPPPRRGLLEMIDANPLRAGLAGVALAALLAFLARWPLLVALPGLLVGVTAGLILIMRNRPVAGGIISLAAILLPIALAPKQHAPITEFHETVASTPPSPDVAEPSKPAPIMAAEVPKPPPDAPLEVSSAAPGTPEPPAPVAAIPALPPVIAKSAPASDVPQTPPPSRIEPRKILSAIVDKLTPAPSVPQTPPPVVPGPGKTAAASSSALPSLPPLPEVVPTPNTAPPSRPEDLVFLVDSGVARGTGFLAMQQGRVYFFTNLHVVSGAKKINARSTLANFDFKDGNIEIAADRDLVRFAVPAQPALQFGEIPKVDDAVVALGNSGGREVVTRLEGKVLGVGPAQIEVSSEFIPGNSGGPLLDKNNRVLGVATYVLRGESVPDWIKAGTRFSTTRRFGVRVTDDVKWETMPLATLLRQTTILQTGEELLGEYIADINAMASRPFAQALTTKFPDRSELRFFVDDYNRSCREYSGRNRAANKADFIARLRDHVGKLSRGIHSTGQMVGRELGTASKGYAKEKETDLLKAYDELATAIDKDERELFHF